MSGDSNLMGVHTFVEILVLTSMIDRVALGLSRCQSGYMGIQCELAQVRLRKSMCGSCNIARLYNFGFRD
jgi:hypothetical protein